MKTILLASALTFALSVCPPAAKAADYVVTDAPGGLAVSKLHGANAVAVKGSPFYFNPFPASPDSTPEDLVTSRDGKYLYAIYDADGTDGLASFSMTDGVPTLISAVTHVAEFYRVRPPRILLTVSEDRVYVVGITGADTAIVTVLNARDGALTLVGAYAMGDPNQHTGIINPLSFQVDKKGHYAEVTYYSADNTFQYGTCTTYQCTALYDISDLSAATNGLPLVLTSSSESLAVTGP